MEAFLAAFIVGVLGMAALLTTARIVRGPSVLDRAIASEVLVTILVCALGAEAALTRHTTTLPILVSISLLGFIASVAVVRFVPRDVDPGSCPVPLVDSPDSDDDTPGYPGAPPPAQTPGGRHGPDEWKSRR